MSVLSFFLLVIPAKLMALIAALVIWDRLFGTYAACEPGTEVTRWGSTTIPSIGTQRCAA